MNSNRTFWGSIFKDKCGVCLQDSGWRTLDGVKAWTVTHALQSCHMKYARFLKKPKIRRAKNVKVK